MWLTSCSQNLNKVVICSTESDGVWIGPRLWWLSRAGFKGSPPTCLLISIYTMYHWFYISLPNFVCLFDEINVCCNWIVRIQISLGFRCFSLLSFFPECFCDIFGFRNVLIVEAKLTILPIYLVPNYKFILLNLRSYILRSSNFLWMHGNILNKYDLKNEQNWLDVFIKNI